MALSYMCIMYLIMLTPLASLVPPPLQLSCLFLRLGEFRRIAYRRVGERLFTEAMGTLPVTTELRKMSPPPGGAGPHESLPLMTECSQAQML